jgi:hypothetical protein
MKLAVVLIFCTVSALAQDQSAISAAESACGSFTGRFDTKRDDSQHALAQPEAGKALIYVIQDMGVVNCIGACITTRVALDGTWVGANEHNSYFSFAVDPGEHHLCVNRQSRMDLLSRLVALAQINAEAGKTYFFRTRTSGGRYETFLDLDPIDPDQGRLFVASYPLSVSHLHK